jgi:GxxExxY protein
MDLNLITESIIGAAIQVHRALGPGLLESTYEVCLMHELAQKGLEVDKQVPIPIIYKDVRLDAGYRIDLLVEDQVIVELKSVDTIHPIHEAQLISYLKLSGKKLGLIINFNVKLLKNGIRRIAN